MKQTHVQSELVTMCQLFMYQLSQCLNITHRRKNKDIQSLWRIVCTNFWLKLGLSGIANELASNIYNQFRLKDPFRYLEGSRDIKTQVGHTKRTRTMYPMSPDFALEPMGVGVAYSAPILMAQRQYTRIFSGWPWYSAVSKVALTTASTVAASFDFRNPFICLAGCLRCPNCQLNRRSDRS